MRRGVADEATVYKVVVNHEEFYSVWPAERENPLGWSDMGKWGTRRECLEYVGEVWTDMRPLSLRKRLEAEGGEGMREPEAFANAEEYDEEGRRRASEEYMRNVVTRLAEGVRAYVLDARLELVPAGVDGELFIGGPIAHGHGAASEETADLFLPDPYSPEPGARIYRTGLRARVTPDYSIEITGGLLSGG